MGLQEELNEIGDQTNESDDPEELGRFQKRCETILANVSRSMVTEQDAGLRGHLQGVEEQAQETLQAVKQRLAEVRIERMDPEFEERKAQKLRDEESKKQAEMEKARQFLSGGGLGDLLGGLLGSASGAKPAGAGKSSSAAAPAARSCAECGSELKAGAKFCPECGAQVTQERRCAACGIPLTPAVKFCPDCGAKQP